MASLTLIEVHYDCGMDAQAAFDFLSKRKKDVSKIGKSVLIAVYPAEVPKIKNILDSIALVEDPDITEGSKYP